MIVTCTFVIWYSVHGLSHQYRQPPTSCKDCSELIAAYLEAGPPEWLSEYSNVVVPMCVRREMEADPA